LSDDILVNPWSKPGANQKKFDWDALDQMLKYRPSIHVCARELGVSRSTIFRKIKEAHGMTFQEYADSVFDSTMYGVEKGLIDKALEGNERISMQFVKVFCNWVERAPIDVTPANIVLNYSLDDDAKETVDVTPKLEGAKDE
jgi:hypothetical protein